LTHRVGIVVPTLGTRPDYLEVCLKSIRLAGDAHILVVAPESLDTSTLQAAGLIDSVVTEQGSDLPSAINQGIRLLPSSVEYVNWLGDDDLLVQGAIATCAAVLDSKEDVVMAFGSCVYIDALGNQIWENRSGQWAVPLLRFGPDLIPQPGALFRRSAFVAVGGLRTDLGWAFDYELFIQFSNLGKLKFLNKPLAQFRWHPSSLSVEHRKKSASEASQVRVSHLPRWLRPLALLWEYPVRQATLIAGQRLTAKAQAKARSS